ncbi:MAG TPA: hypothetical protein VMM77_11860 [Gemmatimonadaceae bacterium]|nr:hypothetical protein [Gemmatimonadaceae bacterium]
MDFKQYAKYHRSFLLFLALIVGTALAVDAFVIYKRVAYAGEIKRLRSGMSELERRKTDIALESEEKRLTVMMELIRRQARLDKRIHLAVAMDSAVMYLGREGSVLREIDIEIGPERLVGIPPDTVMLAHPRGERSVQKVLGARDSWEVPQWVYLERGLPVPEKRTVDGALGPIAVILNGGLVIYTMPSVGPLNDSTYILPGSIRISAEDLRAVAPNLSAGTAVYFY